MDVTKDEKTKNDCYDFIVNCNVFTGLLQYEKLSTSHESVFVEPPLAAITGTTEVPFCMTFSVSHCGNILAHSALQQYIRSLRFAGIYSCTAL